jgi:basic membrane protein A
VVNAATLSERLDRRGDLRDHLAVKVVAGLALAGLVAAIAAGCGGSSGAGKQAAPAPVREQTVKRLRVALVLRVGGPGELNMLAAKGLQDAIVQQRVEGDVVEPASRNDYLPTLTRLAKGGYDLVVSIGEDSAAATWQAAKAFPDARFAIVDYAYPERRSLPNLESLAFDGPQAGYVVGYLAGMMTKTGTVATVGGRRIPRVEGYLAGFAQGAADARPGTRTLVAFSNDFTRPARCAAIAAGQVARGADVVFPVAGACGRGALDVARRKGVWGVGLDTDMSYLGPHILTSAVKRYDVVVLDAIQGVANGTVESTFGTMAPYGFHGGGVTVYGVNYRGVWLGKVSPQVPSAFLARVDALRRRLVGGAIAIPDRIR